VQLLFALPELEIAEKLGKTEKYVGYNVGYININFCI